MKQAIIDGVIFYPTNLDKSIPIAIICDGKRIEIYSTNSQMESSLATAYKDGGYEEKAKEQGIEDFNPALSIASSIGSMFIYDEPVYTENAASEIRAKFKELKNDARAKK